MATIEQWAFWVIVHASQDKREHVLQPSIRQAADENTIWSDDANVYFACRDALEPSENILSETRCKATMDTCRVSVAPAHFVELYVSSMLGSE